jgi:hypothetical protein
LRFGAASCSSILDRGVQPHQEIERRRLLHAPPALNNSPELLGWIAAEMDD